MSGHDGALSHVAKWSHRHLGTIEHERRVTRIALNLLAVTAPRHELDARHRRLLMLGILVHDVGRSVDDERHPQIGAKMIAAARSLNLTKSERRAMGYLTRYHRGAVPKMGKDDFLSPKDDAKQLLLALAFLRVADALDNRNLDTPILKIEFRRGGLHITAQLAKDSARARRVYRKRRKFRLLEEQLGIAIHIDVNIATELPARSTKS